jgi:heptosyltransferase-3
VESIVIYRLGSLGDTIVALPCFHAIENAYPRARKIVLTNSPVAANAAPVESILGGSGLVDEFVSYGVGLRHPRALVELRRKLRAFNATTLIYLTSSTPPRNRLPTILRDLVFFRLCGFRSIVGAPIARDLRLYRVEPATGVLEREAERLARCLSVLGQIDFNDPAFWDLRFTAVETTAAHRFLAPLADHDFIVAHVGGKVAANDWGDDNWSAILRHISRRWPDLGLLVVGSDDERERNDRLMAQWTGPALNGAGMLSPRVSGATMRSAKMFIGHDSGPMHLAASLGIPCVALFGSNNKPGKWHPFGPNWMQHRLIHDMSGIRNIEQGRVIELVEHMLRRETRQVSMLSPTCR